MQSKHGSLECAILNSLWELEISGCYAHTVKDVFNYVNKNMADSRAYTTIKTVLDRLHEKRLVLRYKQEKKFVYRTTQSKVDFISNSLKNISDRFCDGNLCELTNILSNMIEAQRAEYELI